LTKTILNISTAFQHNYEIKKMTVDEMRKMERQLEEMGIDIDTIIKMVEIAQKENGVVVV